jgi:hypothetical protein
VCNQRDGLSRIRTRQLAEDFAYEILIAPRDLEVSDGCIRYLELRSLTEWLAHSPIVRRSSETISQTSHDACQGGMPSRSNSGAVVPAFG